MKHYRFGGLAVQSDLTLDGLVADDDTAADIDLTIRNGQVAEAEFDGENVSPGLSVNKSEALVILDGARILIRDGREMIVETDSGLKGSILQFFLFSEAMPIVMHQRGLIPLHAASFLTPDGEAVGLVGQSGMGKSTLIAKMMERGLRIISDDIFIINAKGEQVLIQSSSPRLKLLGDTMDITGRDTSVHQQIGSPWSKYMVDMGSHYTEGQFPLKRLYFLHWSDAAISISDTPVSRFECFQSVLAQVHYGRLPFMMGRDEDYLAELGHVAATVPAFNFSRPSAIDQLDQSVDTLMAHLHD